MSRLKRIQPVRRRRYSAVELADAVADESIQRRRQILADFCKLVETRIRDRPSPKMLTTNVDSKPTNAAENVKGGDTEVSLPQLSPRMRQTLERLLIGDSEKQIAAVLGLSKHTVHVYVKALYKGFAVNSRGELLARFVRAPDFAMK